MNFTEWLTERTQASFKAAEGLVALVDADALDWKPETGHNWMTTGQLLEHLTTSCGAVMQAFATGDFEPLMAGMDAVPEGETPSAAHLKTVTDLGSVKTRLAADKALALATIADTGEDALASKQTTAPWNPGPRVLGVQFGECIDHLNSHKSQLFYYLKLQGKPVHTGHLWGI